MQDAFLLASTIVHLCHRAAYPRRRPTYHSRPACVLYTILDSLLHNPSTAPRSARGCCSVLR
jgi:hypothetical protein